MVHASLMDGSVREIGKSVGLRATGDRYPPPGGGGKFLKDPRGRLLVW